MKIVYFVRHGKAEARAQADDRDRPLSALGKAEVEAMAKRLQHEPIRIDAILCSPAERAGQTADILAGALHYAPPRIVLPELYTGTQDQIIQAIHACDNACTTVMLVGHNPGLSGAAHRLVQNYDSQIRTSGVLGVHFLSTTWQALSRDEAHLFLYDFPVRLAPKVYKQAQKTIREEVVGTLGGLLEPFDHTLPASLRKTIEKTSQRLAKDVLHVLHTSRLDSMLHQERPENKADPTGEPPPVDRQ